MFPEEPLVFRIRREPPSIVEIPWLRTLSEPHSRRNVSALFAPMQGSDPNAALYENRAYPRSVFHETRPRLIQPRFRRSFCSCRTYDTCDIGSLDYN